MTDPAYYEDQYDQGDGRSGRRRAVLSSLFGAVISVGVLAALVLWVYRVSERDPLDVPVVQALEGPMKVRPRDPGGLKLEETDLAVTRIVSGEDPAEETVLAPPPEEPAEDDMPPAQRAAASEPESEPAPETATDIPATTVPVRRLDLDEEVRVASADPAAATRPPASTVPVTRLDLDDASERAPAVAPRVRGRPVELDTSPTRTPVAAVAAPAREIRKGDFVIQLGAFKSIGIAREQWDKQSSANSDLLRGFGNSVTTTVSGGAILYRLRTGPFESQQAAENVCAALKGRGGDCLVTRMRE